MHMVFYIADHVTVLVISGSTAVGKTELSLHLAQKLNGEIISADSAQVCNAMPYSNINNLMMSLYRCTKEWTLVRLNYVQRIPKSLIISLTLCLSLIRMLLENSERMH